LAEARVVELVSVVNPETGRHVKGTRLLEEWSWREGTENNTVIKCTPSHIEQVVAQRKEPVITSVLDNISREDYLNIPDVNNFISWLEKRLDTPREFEHHYYLVKAKQQWHCTCLYEAYEKYWWPYNMTCPIQGTKVSGSGILDSFNYIKVLAELLRTSVLENDVNLVRKSALAMLSWGGVLNGNRERIVDMGEDVCNYFRRVKESMSLSETRLGNHDGIFINSGFTKLYFLLVDDFIMYDGRVGAALGLLGRLYSEEIGLEKIPRTIEFSFGKGKESRGKQLTGNRRNPSKGNYKLPEFSGDRNRHINDNIKASWLLKTLADKTTSRFALLPQGPLLNERLTAIQSALFMIGYDVRSDRI